MKKLNLIIALIAAQYFLISPLTVAQSKDQQILTLKDSIFQLETRLSKIQRDINSIQDSFNLISTKLQRDIYTSNTTIQENNIALSKINIKLEDLSKYNTTKYNVLVSDDFDNYSQRWGYVSTSYIDSNSLKILAQSYIKFNEYYYIEEYNSEPKKPSNGSINGHKFQINNYKIEGDLFSFPADRTMPGFTWVYHNSSLDKDNTEYLIILAGAPFPKMEDINKNYHTDISISVSDHVYGEGEIMAILAVKNDWVKSVYFKNSQLHWNNRSLSQFKKYDRESGLLKDSVNYENPELVLLDSKIYKFNSIDGSLMRNGQTIEGDNRTSFSPKQMKIEDIYFPPKYRYLQKFETEIFDYYFKNSEWLD